MPNAKLMAFEKPFSQTAVQYQQTTDEISRRCETCAFFRAAEIHDPCLIVPNNVPSSILHVGVCVKWVPIELMPLEDTYVEDALEDEYIEEEEMLSTDLPDDVTKALNDSNIMGEIWATIQKYLKKMQFSKPDPLMNISGMKVIRTTNEADIYYLAWYSNNFEDLEADIFSLEGIDAYNERVAKGIYPPPELWCMHEEYLKHGQGLKTFRLGHFQLVLGKFDNPSENQLVLPFIKYYEENPVTMSHGFLYDPDTYIDKVFHRFVTFETSTIVPGREANPHFTYLSLPLKEARMLRGSDRDFVAGIIGEELLKTLENSAEERGKLLEEQGVAFKALAALPDTPAKESMEVLSSVLVAALQKFAHDNSHVLGNTTDAMRDSAQTVVNVEETLQQIEAQLSSIRSTLARLEDPSSARFSAETVVPDDNSAADFLEEKNHSHSPTKRPLSLLSSLAVQMGDDPRNYE